MVKMGEKGAASEAEMKGWLYKWTNYIRGYQKRWFVLNNVTGLLSYYRSPQEVAHTCRGTVSLKGATITTEDSNNFVISASCGTQTWHLKASNEVFRQKWVTSLELAKAKASSNCTEDEEDEEDILEEEDEGGVDRSGEHRAVIRMLHSKLDELKTCQDVLVKQGGSLVSSLQNLESLFPKQQDHQVQPQLPPEFSSLTKTLGERTALFRLTCTAMINACKDYADLANAQGKKWQRLLQHERDQRLKMEEMVETLARQHSHLERSVVQQEQQQNPQQPQPMPQELSQDETAASSSDNDDMEFFDAVEENESEFIVHSATALPSTKPAEQLQIAKKPSSGGRKRRTTIPERPNVSVNLWSIMKNCIGKELTKIPMPVNFSEPLSLLQRLAEEYEYGYLLDQAANCTDPWEQLAYIAAFTISPYAATAYRTGKPFNPLLGETYEWDRTEDLGWRTVAEQVSHHPPIAAQHCQGKNWTVYQEFSMSSKFRGKYLQIVPLGTSHLFITNNSGGDGTKKTYHFTWRKVSTTVHNIIVGKLWVDNHGEMDIVNHTTGDKCHLKFIPYSYFSREAPRRVTGYVTAKDGSVKWVVSGTWDNEIGAAKVLKYAGSGEGGKPVLETGPVKTLWTANKIPPGAERWYNLSEMAIQLNEMEEGVALSDARRRPDQKLMEEGKWDEANQEKVRLEEKQRAARRKREADAEQAASEGKQLEPYKPLWFEQQRDPDTGATIYRFNDKYWECKENQDWSMCPDLF